MGFSVEEVVGKASRKAFFGVTRILYKDDPHWVCPLDQDIEDIFKPEKNIFFTHGEAIRWILRDESGTVVGRIAAFINEKKAFSYEMPTGGIGFFECINNQEAANFLFDTAKAWLSERKMEAMDGPINFGENDRYWGLLVEGFTQPTFQMYHHLPYYKDLFETYGFQVYFEQNSNEMDLNRPLPERFEKIARWVMQKDGIEFKHGSWKTKWKYAKVLQEVYNDAWQYHENFTPLQEKQLARLMKDFRFIAIHAFLPYVEVKGEPAAFILCIPDLNQIFKPIKGQFSLWKKLLFLWRSRNEFAWYRKRGILTRGRVIIMGAKPKFQKYGLEAGMIISSFDYSKAMGFKAIELSWVGDFNPKMERLHEATGATHIHKHITYRCPFDPSIEISRYATIPMDRPAGE